MKQSQFTATAILTALMPASSVMAHSEASGSSGIMQLMHGITHAIQTMAWLPASLLIVLITLVVISRIKNRES